MAKSVKNGLFAHIGGMCAFLALFLGGLSAVILFFTSPNGFTNFLGTVQPWLLTFGIGLTGWNYLCSINPPGPDILWKVFYLVFLILAIVGLF